MEQKICQKPSEQGFMPTSIGGQAVMEGVMMRGKDKMAIAVRVPDGSITIEKQPLSSVMKKYPVLKLPVLRGVVAFVESMIIGVKALMFSASFFDIEGEEGEQPSKFDMWLEKVAGEKLKDYVLYFSMFLSLVLGIGLFMLLPTVLTGWIKSITPFPWISTIVEGFLRIGIFIVYIWAISKMPDIQRVFQYHGAEHKTIFAFEAGEELTIENVKKHTTLHPRCGTSFLLIVMVVSMILFFPFHSQNVWLRLIIRLSILPLVAGISYEIIKWAGRSNSWLSRTISIPGLWFQRFTTREPDDSQIEVAIASLEAVLSENREDDRW